MCRCLRLWWREQRLPEVLLTGSGAGGAVEDVVAARWPGWCRSHLQGGDAIARVMGALDRHPGRISGARTIQAEAGGEMSLVIHFIICSR